MTKKKAVIMIAAVLLTAGLVIGETVKNEQVDNNAPQTHLEAAESVLEPEIVKDTTKTVEPATEAPMKPVAEPATETPVQPVEEEPVQYPAEIVLENGLTQAELDEKIRKSVGTISGPPRPVIFAPGEEPVWFEDEDTTEDKS